MNRATAISSETGLLRSRSTQILRRDGTDRLSKNAIGGTVFDDYEVTVARRSGVRPRRR
jgi:hypothetical protein